MKKALLSIVAFLPVMAFAQDGTYIIQGKVGNYNAPAKMYLRYEAKGKVVTDSVKLKDGNFQFKGSVSNGPQNAYLMFNQAGTGPAYKDYKSIFLEPGTLNVNSPDSVSKATINGPKTNMDNARYDAQMKPFNDEQDAIDAKAKGATPEQRSSDAFEKEITTSQKALDAKQAEANKKFIQDNPDSYISLEALEMYAYNADYKDIAPLYNGLSESVKHTKSGKEFGERLPKLKAIAIGAMAPEFTEADTSGKMVSLASFRGKYVLLDFWASWCGPCRRENPNVVKAYNKYKGKNFTILSVSLDRPNGKQKWLDAIHKDGLTWNHVSDLQFWQSKVAGLYAVRAIPQNFLIGPDGKIIAHNLMGDDLEDKLAELFGKI